MPEIQLSQGTIRYRDEGSGPVVVLIHGLLVDGSLWGPVVERLSTHARCILPDLPLGSHRQAMRDAADLSPSGIASLIGELVERLELTDVTLVGSDTGGALCQLVAVNHPKRLARLVLTNCDAFDNFPPAAFRPVVRGLARVPGAVALLDLLGRLPLVRRATMKLAPLTTEPIQDQLLRAWVSPLHDRRVRRDLVRVLRGLPGDHTLHASERAARVRSAGADRLGNTRRVLPPDGRRPAPAVLRNARVERIDSARTFVPLDAPDRLAELVAAFAAEPAPAAT